MRRPDDSSLTRSQLAKIRSEAERALRDAGVFGVLPTPVEEVMRVARVREMEEDLANPGFLSKLVNKAEKAGQAVKRALSKVLGLFHASDGLIFIDRTLMVVKQRFVRLHEAAHGFLPWQRPMYAVVQDCEKALDPDTADLFDREANVFASEVLFQIDTFRDQADELPFTIRTPLALAKKFNASVYASVRQYVSKNRRACAVLVLNPPVPVPGLGFRAELRRPVQSEGFTAMFGACTWREYYTPDDDLGALIPVGHRKSSAPRPLGLRDGNGALHECVAEAFTNTIQVFVLIHVVKTLTATHLLLRQPIARAL
jgi:Zn-dependent peptidase ImmA (M78 family)